jgi:hypothetical protein
VEVRTCEDVCLCIMDLFICVCSFDRDVNDACWYVPSGVYGYIFTDAFVYCFVELDDMSTVYREQIQCSSLSYVEPNDDIHCYSHIYIYFASRRSPNGHGRPSSGLVSV